MYVNTIEEIINNLNKKNMFFKTLKRCISSPIIIPHTKLDRIFGRTIKHKHICKCLYETININKLGNFKYNGRYVFLSLMGCYEFFSVLFSLFTVILCIWKYIKYMKVINRAIIINYKLKKQILIYRNLYFILTFLTSLSSVFLHIHENLWTTRWDYLCAMLSIIFTTNLFLEKTKILLHHSNYRYNLFKKLSTLIFSIVLYDQYYSNNFDAVFNKIISGGFMIILLFNFFIHLRIRRSTPLIKYHLSLMTLFLILSLFFEVIDMPPFFYLIDSHAMWHFCLFLCSHHITEYLIIDIFNE